MNLAKSVDLRIEALNAPTSAGQPQVFQLRPSALLLSALGDLIPTEGVMAAAIPVTIDVTWGVEDVNGDPVGFGEAVVYSGAVEHALQATVMVRPDFVELRSGMEIPTKTRYVTASVKLAARIDDKEFTVDSLPLLRAPITVPAIPVPTVALFFAKPNLGMSDGSLADGDQFIVIVVPRDSPIGSMSALRFAFDKLREVSKTAEQIVSLASVGASGLAILTGLRGLLDTLDGAVGAHAPARRVGGAFVVADTIRSFNDIDTIPGAFIWNNDIEAEDTISSCALIGPPGRRMRCYKDRNFTGRRVSITVSDFGLTIVEDFESTNPTTQPAGMASQTTEPLDNDLSSMAFL